MIDSLTGDGRVWIYGANRPLNASESEIISSEMKAFCISWQAHGNDLHADFEIINHQLLVLAVDEHFEAASGCSIDTAVNQIKKIDSKYELDLFNRTNLFFLDNERLIMRPYDELKNAYQKGDLTDQTLTYNNAISTLQDLRSNWIIPFSKSWAHRKTAEFV